MKGCIGVARCLVIGLLLVSGRARAADARADDKAGDTNAVWLAEHYTKYEHRIPMRDGVRLFTRVYVPKDDSQRWPIILTRTPYALKPYGVDNYNDPSGSFRTLARDNFILVTQDVHVRPFNPKKGPKDIDENSDTYDTIDWLVKNVPNNNGNVGIFGISYPGFLTAVAGIGAHPALKAISPQAPMGDAWMGDDFFHQGAFRASYGLEYSWRMEASSDLSVTPSPARYDTYEWYL